MKTLEQITEILSGLSDNELRGGYYDDMINACLEDLNNQLKELCNG